MSIDYNDVSGWTENSLILDGSNDWVKMSYIHYENMTVEIVAKPLDINTTKQQKYISNLESGGIGISKNSSNCNYARIYAEKEYKDATSMNNSRIGQIYSMSTGYNGNSLYFRENEVVYQIQESGTNKVTEYSTIFAIGTKQQKN